MMDAHTTSQIPGCVCVGLGWRGGAGAGGAKIRVRNTFQPISLTRVMTMVIHIDTEEQSSSCFREGLECIIISLRPSSRD